MSARDHRNQPCANDDCEHLVTIWPGGQNQRDEHVKVCRSKVDEPGYVAEYYHLDCVPDDLVPQRTQIA